MQGSPSFTLCFQSPKIVHVFILCFNIPTEMINAIHILFVSFIPKASRCWQHCDLDDSRRQSVLLSLTSLRCEATSRTVDCGSSPLQPTTRTCCTHVHTVSNQQKLFCCYGLDVNLRARLYTPPSVNSVHVCTSMSGVSILREQSPTF